MRRFASLAVTLITLTLSQITFAQTSSTASVPTFIRYEGTLHDSRGAAASTTVGVTFAIYKQQEGGAPVWMETQNVAPDAHGSYTVTLGSTTATGLPADLFSAQEQRWLGVQVQGEVEQPRVLLVSVPYAFKAHEAETLGGRPASAFALAPQSGVSGVSNETSSPSNAPASGGPGGPKSLVSGHGAAGYIAYWTNPVLLGDSAIYQSASGNLGVGSQNPQSPLDVFANNGSAVIVGQQGNNAGVAVEGDALGSGGSAANIGVLGTTRGGNGIGVEGNAIPAGGNTIGVLGQSASPTGSGVQGNATAGSGSATGVYGTSAATAGYGVFGYATAGSGSATGVFGQTDSTTGYGVQGQATASSGMNVGVFGSTVSAAGYAIYAQNSATTGNAFGSVGLTKSQSGVGMFGFGVGQSAEGQKITLRPAGVWGDTNQGSGIGVLATADFGIAFAGYNNAENISTVKFQNDENIDETGNILATKGGHYGGICEIDVSGDLGCTGNIGGVVPVDSSTRKVSLYAVQAPENWFEDIGSARLSNGSTMVQLESTFAQTVNSEVEYHVFLTPKGDCRGLYVTNETADSFEVRELGGGTANVGFDYRIVARRKGYENVRLADRTKRIAQVANEPRQGPGKVTALEIPKAPLSGRK